MNRLHLAAILALVLPAQTAAQGVTADKIQLGQSCALRGPARSLGTGMQTGLNVYFDAINAEGGIGGRKISLFSINDGYEPKKCKLTTKMLITRKDVFALIGGVGTPTAKVAVPIAESLEVPFLAPFTGAEFLRNPHKKWVVNIRGSYFQEMETLAAHLVDGLGYRRIACFYQDDGYGKAGLTGIQKALQRRGLKLCGTGTYKRNTIAIQSGLESVEQAKPQAVIMVGAYRPCAEFIKTARTKSSIKNAKFCNISFVGTKALHAELGSMGEGCIISQVVPYPFDTKLPLVAEFHEAMKKAGKESDIGFITLEGYMAAKFFCQAVSEVQGDLTRESFLAAIQSKKNFDLGGVTLRFGKNDHQGMDEVFLTEIRGGKVVPLGGAQAAPGK